MGARLVAFFVLFPRHAVPIAIGIISASHTPLGSVTVREMPKQVRDDVWLRYCFYQKFPKFIL